MGVFAQMVEGLVSEAFDRKTLTIDVSRRTPYVRVSLLNFLKAHRTALSLQLKKVARQADWMDEGWREYQVACRRGRNKRISKYCMN